MYINNYMYIYTIIYIYIYVYIFIYIYIYIGTFRRRPRTRYIHVHTHTHTNIHTQTHMHACTQTDRETERQRERERDTHTHLTRRLGVLASRDLAKRAVLIEKVLHPRPRHRAKHTVDTCRTDPSSQPGAVAPPPPATAAPASPGCMYIYVHVKKAYIIHVDISTCVCMYKCVYTNTRI